MKAVRSWLSVQREQIEVKFSALAACRDDSSTNIFHIPESQH
jgi:hypothetical protein